VDQERRVDLVGAKRLEDARVGLDGNHDGLELREEQAQREVRGRAQAGHADALARERRQRRLALRHDDRPVATPH